jgi:hypothetical protein
MGLGSRMGMGMGAMGFMGEFLFLQSVVFLSLLFLFLPSSLFVYHKARV